MAPALAGEHSGDPRILAELARYEGFKNLSVAVIDLDDDQPVRFANTGSTRTTAFEVGSITKALTGLVIADEVRRGETDLTSPVSDYLPLTGTAAGAVTLQDLVTHHSGYPALGAGTLHHAIWRMPLGLNVLDTSREDVLQEIRDTEPDGRGSYNYSNLGAAAAGMAVAAAAGMTYPDLMRARLFAPLGMSDTVIQTTALVAGGQASMGRPVQPWAMDGYAPAGAVVSTTKDMSALALAVLRGTAPGRSAMTPIASTDSDNTEIGIFWKTTRWANGQTITWHNGGSGGYSAYLGFDLEHYKAVVVLSDVAKSVDDIGHRLLIPSVGL
jgi:CubicO group peptidase (beta-lactamase class C family)